MPESLGLPEVVAGIVLLGLTAYVLFGGADFGGGVWDLLASGPRREAQRALVANAIGPIWEANHVWLILVIVLLFTAFPAAFAALSVVLHLPLALMLVGIVLRGAAFVFRSYGHWRGAAQQRWGRVFAIASTVTPLFLGVSVGAVASGAVGAAAARVGAPDAHFGEVYVRPWLAPFPLAVGVLALALFAYLAAVYLAVAAREEALREDFRRRALAAGVAVFVAAALALLVAHGHAPRLRWGLVGAAWALPLQLAIGAAASLALWALFVRRWRVARVAAAAQASLILWGWGLAQFPLLVPPAIAIRSAAAPPITLSLLLWGLAGGALLLVPSLWYLFRTFAAAGRSEASTG